MHAFWRMLDGEWRVTSLSAPNWQHEQSLSFPMSELRFGDFTGDGVTYVLGATEDVGQFRRVQEGAGGS
jgi:hypothetical protein